jgi:hypothetical protein
LPCVPQGAQFEKIALPGFAEFVQVGAIADDFLNQRVTVAVSQGLT